MHRRKYLYLFGGLFLTAIFFLCWAIWYHPLTDIALEIKSNQFAFQYHPVPTNQKLKLHQYWGKNKKIIAESFQNAKLSSGRLINPLNSSKAITVKNLFLRENTTNEYPHLEIVPLINEIKLAQWMIIPGTTFLFDKHNWQLRVEMKPPGIFKKQDFCKLELDIPDSVDLLLRDCQVMDEDSVLFTIGSRTVHLKWIPDLQGETISIFPSGRRNFFLFELDSTMENTEIFSGFQARQINFIDSIGVKPDLIVKSSILDSSRIRFFDSERKVLKLEKGDIFHTDSDSFFMESIQLTPSGFWLNFQGKFKSLETGRVGFPGQNQVDNFLVKLTHNSILTAVISISFGIISLITAMLTIKKEFIPESPNEPVRIRRHFPRKLRRSSKS